MAPTFRRKNAGHPPAHHTRSYVHTGARVLKSLAENPVRFCATRPTIKRPLSIGGAPHCSKLPRFNLTATSAAPPQELSAHHWNSPHFLSILLRQLSRHLLHLLRYRSRREGGRIAVSYHDNGRRQIHRPCFNTGDFEPQRYVRSASTSVRGLTRMGGPSCDHALGGSSNWFLAEAISDGILPCAE